MLRPTAASNRGLNPRAVMPTSNGNSSTSREGNLATKHIVGALPEDGERPVKTTRKVSVDGWDRADEEETRPDPRTRRQLERTHTVFRTTLLMCIAGQPQFAHLRLSKETLDEWYEWFYGRTSRVADPPWNECSNSQSAAHGARFMTWSTPVHHSLRPFPSSVMTTFSGRGRCMNTAAVHHELR